MWMSGCKMRGGLLFQRNGGSSYFMSLFYISIFFMDELFEVGAGDADWEWEG